MKTYTVELRHAASKRALNQTPDNRLDPLNRRLESDAEAAAFARDTLMEFARRRGGEDYRYVEAAVLELLPIGQTLEGKTCLVSGSGNVAQYTIEKLLDLGAKPVTVSDSNGYVYDEAGIDRDKLAFIIDLKDRRRGRIKEYADKYSSATYFPADSNQDSNPLWDHKADCAFPSELSAPQSIVARVHGLDALIWQVDRKTKRRVDVRRIENAVDARR